MSSLVEADGADLPRAAMLELRLREALPPATPMSRGLPNQCLSQANSREDRFMSSWKTNIDERSDYIQVDTYFKVVGSFELPLSSC